MKRLLLAGSLLIGLGVAGYAVDRVVDAGRCAEWDEISTVPEARTCEAKTAIDDYEYLCWRTASHEGFHHSHTFRGKCLLIWETVADEPVSEQ